MWEFFLAVVSAPQILKHFEGQRLKKVKINLHISFFLFYFVPSLNNNTMQLIKQTELFEQVVKILREADGEDLDEIIERIGAENYLLHSLMMRASEDEIQYYLAERNNLKSKK